MSTNNIVVLDLLNGQESHRDFNTNVYHMYAKSSAKILWVCDRSVSYLDNLSGFTARKIRLRNPGGRFHRWIVINLFIVRYILKYRRSRIVFLHLPPLSQFWVCILAAVLKGLKIEIFLHGELVYLEKNTGAGQKFGALCLRYVLKENTTNVVKHCLSQSIFNRLTEMAEINRQNVKYGFYQINEHRPIRSTKSTEGRQRILATGVVSKRKGFLLVNKLADNLSAAQTFDIMVFGRTDGTLCKHDFDRRITVGLFSDMIPNTEYQTLLSESSLVFIPQLFSREYELVYSGLVETCLRQCIPIITKRTRFLAEIEASVGPIGVLCDDVCEVGSINFGSFDVAAVENFRRNLENWRNEQ